MKKLPTYQTRWDLTPLFVSDKHSQILKQRAAVKKAAKTFISHWKGNSSYLKNTKSLRKALDEYEDFQRFFGSFGKESYYLHLKTMQDQISPKLKARHQQINELSTKLWNDLQFFTINLSKVSPDMQEIFLKSPSLDKFRHFLFRLFIEGRYLLSDNEEKIINLKSGPAHTNWVRMMATFLSKEERKVLGENGEASAKTLPEIMSLINSQNKQVRDSADKALDDILEKNSEIAESELNSVLENKKINDELKGYTRPDQSRHISDDIKTEVVDNLVECVSLNFQISQRYYQLKAKIMRVSKLKYHERNVFIGKVNVRYSYQQAVDLILKVMQNLDPQFAQIFTRFLKNGQIDVYPKKGKRDGAFCSYGLVTNPTYILLNFTGQLSDVLTLAHELGHGINNELIKTKQNALNFGTPTSTAEVASTFMEDFVLDEILKSASDELRLSVMMMKLNDDISTIFRQIACYKFEQELHQQIRTRGYLSKEDIGKLFISHMSSYMGDFVEQSKGSENWWVYWSHIRMFFYNYSYAGGLLISKYLQSQVKKDSQYTLKVKEFLSTGLTLSPQDIFLRLGIDISQKNFWLGSLKEVEKLLDETENLAKKLKQI